jgi:hypothetical protein
MSRITPRPEWWVRSDSRGEAANAAHSDHSDAELWATVAFLKQLPEISEQDYARLVMTSSVHGGHAHPDSGADKPESKP